MQTLVYYDFPTAWQHIKDYGYGRWRDLREHIEPFTLASNIIFYFMVRLAEAPSDDKHFNGNSPWFWAFPATGLSAFLISLQFMMNLSVNRNWANGNLYLIAMEIYTILAFLAQILLTWNFDIYLYDLRIVRLVMAALAVLFWVVYIISAAVWADLVFLKEAIGDKGTIYDIMIVLFIGYNLMYNIPTAVINAIIIGKELTLNQFAWSKDADWKAGKLFDTWSNVVLAFDIFKYFGVQDDP